MANQKSAVSPAKKNLVEAAKLKTAEKTANGVKAPEAKAPVKKAAGKKSEVKKPTNLTAVPREQVIKPGRTGRALAAKAIRGVTKPVTEDEDVNVVTAPPVVETGDVLIPVPAIEGSKDDEFEAEWLADLAAKGALVVNTDGKLNEGEQKPRRTQIITTHLQTAQPPKVKKAKGEGKTSWEDIKLPEFDDSGVEMTPEQMKLELLRLKRIVDCLTQKIPLRLYLSCNMK